MRKYLILLILSSIFMATLPSCSKKSGCPTYDKKTGQYSIKGKKKTESGLFPKKMK